MADEQLRREVLGVVLLEDPQRVAQMLTGGLGLTIAAESMAVEQLGLGDTVAPVSSHSSPFYNTLPSSLDKAYLELRNASHFTPNSSNTTIAKYSISWLKRFIDNDARYEQFLCPAPSANLQIAEYRDTCPHS